MKLTVLCLAGLFALASIASATTRHFQIGLDCGYGLGVGKQLMGYNTEATSTSSGAYSKYEEVYGSFGNGAKMNIDLTYFVTDNLGIMAMGGISALGGYSVKSVTASATSKTSILSNYAMACIGIKMKSGIGTGAGSSALSPYLYMAPGAIMPLVFGTSFSGTSDTSTLVYRYSPGMGLSCGAGIQAALLQNFACTMEIAPTYAFADLKEIKRTRDGETTTTKYLNNTTTLPASTSTTNYQHGRQRRSFSSVSFKVGVCVFW